MLQENNSFFPNNTSLSVPHVMDFVEDDPLDFPNDLTAPIDHVPKNFSGHDQTWGRLIDGDITSNKTHIMKILLQLSILLIGKCLDRWSVDDSWFVSHTDWNSVLSNSGLTSGSMGTNQHILLRLDSSYGLLLERIQCELVLSRVCWSCVNIPFIVFGIEHFMNASILAPFDFNFYVIEFIFILFVIAVISCVFDHFIVLSWHEWLTFWFKFGHWIQMNFLFRSLKVWDIFLFVGFEKGEWILLLGHCCNYYNRPPLKFVINYIIDFSIKISFIKYLLLFKPPTFIKLQT